MNNTRKFPKVRLLIEANEVLKKLKSRTGSITFPQLGRHSDLIIVCYADATSASLEDGFSQGCFIIFVCGMMNRIAFICWPSKNLTE